LQAASANNDNLMQLRFLAVGCNGDVESLAEQKELCQLIRTQSPELHLYNDWPECKLFFLDHPSTLEGENPIRLAAGYRGPVLIGRAFERSNPSAPVLRTGSILADEADNRRGGLRLSNDFWGDYILFEKIASGIEVTRDPKGSLPCYYIKSGRCVVWFSDVADLPRCLTRELRIDPYIVNLNTFFPKMAKARTGLKNIGEVLPGTSLRVVDGAISVLPNWSPKKFASAPYTNIDEAISCIRDSVVEVVSSYARYYDQPVVSIGGLDSSIIWCVSHYLTGHELYGINLYSDNLRGDERSYVAELPGYGRITPVLMDGKNIEPELVFNPRPAVSPPGFVDLIDLAWSPSTVETTARSDAMVYGVGGDNVFLQAADTYSALDYVKANGFQRGAASCILDAARHAQTSVLDVIIQCVIQLTRKPDNWSYFISENLKKLDRSGFGNFFFDHIPELSAFHPHYKDIDDLPPGKAMQINELFLRK
jgi:asparagine synthase (glutamine-hydrolysing)